MHLLRHQSMYTVKISRLWSQGCVIKHLQRSIYVPNADEAHHIRQLVCIYNVLLNMSENPNSGGSFRWSLIIHHPMYESEIYLIHMNCLCTNTWYTFDKLTICYISSHGVLLKFEFLRPLFLVEYWLIIGSGNLPCIHEYHSTLFGAILPQSIPIYLTFSLKCPQ